MITPQALEDGLKLLVNKPLGWTSFDVVNKLRYKITRICSKKTKVGHAGTLDPLATGLLVLCTGKMTKQLQSFQDEDKEYEGTIRLGATTPSFDAETEADTSYPTAHITDALIYATVEQFLGAQAQVPPVFSAIKVDGKPLYLSARKGIEVVVQSRNVTIISFEILHIDMPNVDFRVKCSKGTYIRSLANDFGAAMNSGGYLTRLVRTRSGAHALTDAWELEDLIKELEK